MPESFKEDGRPAQQWYWDDWFSSHDVQSCSLAAQGLWINLLGIMFTSDIRGTLTINGIQMNNRAIAKRFGEDVKTIGKLIAELEKARVFSRFKDGTIYSRRLYRDSKRKEKISEIKSKAGKLGAKVRWQKDSKDMAEDMAKMAAPSSTPSSSSTSSSKKNINKEKVENLFEEKFNEFWKIYPKKIAKDYAKEKFMIIARGGKLLELTKAFNGYMGFLKMRRVKDNFEQEPLNPATFLTKNRWRDYIDFKYTPPL